jgi:hypothetical protein
MSSKPWKKFYGEIVVDDVLITRVSFFFLSQFLILILDITLIVSVLVATAIYDKEWLNLFSLIWAILKIFAMILMWILSAAWIKSCRPLPSPLKNAKENVTVIGKNMFATIRINTIKVTVSHWCILSLLSLLYSVNVSFNGVLDHSIAICILALLLIITWTSIESLLNSMWTQFFPTASVQDVVIPIPVSLNSLGR